MDNKLPSETIRALGRHFGRCGSFLIGNMTYSREGDFPAGDFFAISSDRGVTVLFPQYCPVNSDLDWEAPLVSCEVVGEISMEFPAATVRELLRFDELLEISAIVSSDHKVAVFPSSSIRITVDKISFYVVWNEAFEVIVYLSPAAVDELNNANRRCGLAMSSIVNAVSKR